MSEIIETEITDAKVIEAILAIRDQRSELSKKDKELKAQQEFLEDYMRDILAARGTDNTAVRGLGTAFIAIKDHIEIEDWQAFFAWALEHGANDFIGKSVSKTNVVDFITKNNQEPPGLKYVVERVCHVQRRT